MIHLLKTEWLKIKNYRAFWLVIILTALSYPGVNYMFLNVYKEVVNNKETIGQVAQALLGNPFAFPEVWRTTGFFSSWFVFIPAIVVIMLVTNEYTYKTSRQNIIDGWSRRQFMMAKLIDVALVSAVVTLLMGTVTFFIGLFNTEAGVSNKFELIYYVGLFGLQTFYQLSIAFMIGFLVRKAFIALAIFVFYSMILENILAGFLRVKADDMGRFLPIEISDRLTPIPAFLGRFNEASYKASLAAINSHVIYVIVLSVLLWLFCFWLNKRRDL